MAQVLAYSKFRPARDSTVEVLYLFAYQVTTTN